MLSLLLLLLLLLARPRMNPVLRIWLHLSPKNAVWIFYLFPKSDRDPVAVMRWHISFTRSALSVTCTNWILWVLFFYGVKWPAFVPWSPSISEKHSLSFEGIDLIAIKIRMRSKLCTNFSFQLFCRKKHSLICLPPSFRIAYVYVQAKRNVDTKERRLKYECPGKCVNKRNILRSAISGVLHNISIEMHLQPIWN